MNIRTQHYVGLLASAALALLISITLVVAGREVDAAIERGNYTSQILQGIAQLRFAMIEYILHHHEQPKVQWLKKHESLTRILQSGILSGPAEQEMIELLRRRHEQVGKVFSQLVDNYESKGKSAEQTALSQELETRLVSRVLEISQAMTEDAFRLDRLNQLQVEQAQRRTNAVVILAIVLMALIFAANTVVTIRNVLKPIRELQRGAEIIGKGDLSHRTRIGIGNEIDTLSRAFDHMAERLQEAQASLEEKTNQLVAVNKELESFAYSVAHDLRAPLRSLDGFSQVLLEDYAGRLDEDGQDSLRRIRAAAQRMGALIDDMLALSQVTRREIALVRTDLSEMATAVVAELRQREPQRQVEFIAAPRLVARTDPHLIRIALANLLGNAWKFTGRRALAKIEFGITEHDGKQAYFVGDNGVGFDMAYAGKLFGAFQRMHSAQEFEGTGIGLATVQRIVHRLGGQVWAEAAQDKGATFYFALDDGGKA